MPRCQGLRGSARPHRQARIVAGETITGQAWNVDGGLMID